MNILVTGGSGFIGSHICKALLQERHHVINIDNFDDFYDYKTKVRNTIESIQGGFNTLECNVEKSEDLQKLSRHLNNRKNYKLFIQDIRDQKELKKIFEQNHIDAIIHLAALAGVRPSIERSSEYEQVNINGTINLLELCKKHSIKKFICASSSSVYGNNKKAPFSEEDPVDRAISPYGATKKCCEVIGYVYHHLYNIDMVILRFFTVYGPRQRPDLAIHKFTRLITENREIPFFGDGTTARDYTYISDIIDGMLGSLDYIMSHDKVYEIINLGNHQAVTLSEMVKTLEYVLNIKAKIKPLKLPPGDVLKNYADISKARRLIRYTPKIGFSQGVRTFVNWFKKNK